MICSTAGEHLRGGEVVRAGDRVVDDVDALVGTHLQRLLDRVGGLLGTDAQRGHRDLLAVGLLLELERLLDGVLVELGEQTGHADAVHGVVGLEVPVGGRVGHVLHTDDNVHVRFGPGRGPS